MSDEPCPHVVYHCCAINNYQEVVRSQFLLLRQCGLTAALVEAGDYLRISHVGPDPEWILDEAARQDLPARIVKHDLNIVHYETFAMLEIERLAKVEMTDHPILYFHTKGVSAPGDECKKQWRSVMEWHVLSHWRDRRRELKAFDAAGFNFWFRGANHFSGTFWIANASWIRQLPDFASFHHSQRLSRYSCELWIGSAPGIRAMSLGCNDVITWAPGFDWSWLLPPALSIGDGITWISAATPEYAGQLNHLKRSAERLGRGHQFRGTMLENYRPWRHTRKLEHLYGVLNQVKTSHAFWIDADCEFLTQLDVADLLHPTKQLSAVRHIAYNRPSEVLPDSWRSAIEQDHPVYHQACLFGGRVDEMRGLVSMALSKFGPNGGYDEHALNLVWDLLGPERVHTLPCRYNTPISFAPFASYEAECRRRMEGAARIFHWNTEISR